MERLQQQRSEITSNNYLHGEKITNSRLNLQLMNNGISYGRKKNDNDHSNRSPTTEESTEIEEEEDDDNDDDDDDEGNHEDDDDTDQQTAQANSRKTNYSQKPMVCGVCHLSPGVAGVAGVSAGPGPMLTCTQGHLLCQQCVHRYTVCSDIGCVVCGADLYTTKSTCYRSAVTNSIANLRHAADFQSSSILNPREMGSIRNNTKTSNRVEQSFTESKNWSRNCNKEISGARETANGRILYGGNPQCANTCAGYSSGFDGDSGDAIRSTNHNQTMNGNLRLQQNQQRSYCNSSIRGGDADPAAEPEGQQRVCNSTREGNGNGNGNGNGYYGNGSAATLVHAECSRRPIKCPRLDCAVNVAFSALTHHFLFDHPEVPILSVEPGTKSTLIVSFAALSCDSSRCLALLLVSGKLTGAAARLFNGSQIQPRYRNRLPLSILAARLHCSNENPCNDDTHAHGEGQGQGDVIIAWVAGLDVGVATTGTLRCSIQAVDENDGEELRSLTYTGPVNSLRTAQRPREVLKTGDCVILHQGLIDHITSGCCSLNVNVIVH